MPPLPQVYRLAVRFILSEKTSLFTKYPFLFCCLFFHIKPPGGAILLLRAAAFLLYNKEQRNFYPI